MNFSEFFYGILGDFILKKIFKTQKNFGNIHLMSEIMKKKFQNFWGISEKYFREFFDGIFNDLILQKIFKIRKNFLNF